MLTLLLSLVLAGASHTAPDPAEAFSEAARFVAAGDRGSAGDVYRRLLERELGQTPVRAKALIELARLEIGLGDYGASAAHAREAEAIGSALGDAIVEARSINLIGQIAVYRGEYAEAALAFQSAVDRSSPEADREGLAERLTNLGNAHYFVGHYSDAARAYDRALSVADAAAAEPWAARRRHLIHVNRAILLQRIGRYEQALAIYRDLEGTAKLRADERGQVLMNLGALYRRLEDPIKALATYDAARAFFAKGRHQDGELGVLTNRGIVQALELGQLDAAEDSFTQVLDAATRSGNRREMLLALLYRGETFRLARDTVHAREDFSRGLALARELKTPEEEWKALYGLGRTASTPREASDDLKRAVSVIESVREHVGVPSLRSDFFNDKSEVYDALIDVQLASMSAAEAFTLIERQHSRVWKERLGIAAAVDLPLVQGALAPGVLLLDYWHSSRGSALVAVTGSRAALLPLKVDEAQVKALMDTVASRRGDEWRSLSRALGPQVLPPTEWFDGIDHVIVVADRELSLVPFELLEVGNTLLIKRAAVSYTPTAATILRPRPATPAWLPPWRLQLRGFGDPVFSSATLDEPDVLHERLASSATEVRNIASELGGHAVLHLAGDNRKAHLYDRDERAPIVHLATHATVNATALEQSRLVFSSRDSGDAAADYLFLREAYDLPLAGVELAVLSACDTERGRLTRGEGVQSFSRAFLAAGAQSTVTTLWRVADAPTADFMRLFYYHLRQGVARDEALRRAKLRFLASDSGLAHPHYWAAFVLTGEGQRPVPRAVTWPAVFVSIGVVAFAAVLAAPLLRRRRPAAPVPAATN